VKKSITYIIVTWNNENEIQECLNSIEKYSDFEHKIIIVDNKSTDHTVNIINDKYHKVQLIVNDENLGFAQANNIGLKMVNTPYVCFINPDVVLTEDIVTPSIRELENNNSTGLVSCRLNNKDGSLQPSTFSFANSINLFNEILHIGAFMPQIICKKRFINYYQPKEKFCPDWVIGAEMIMKTSDAKAVDGFSTDYYMYTEDMDLCAKVNKRLHKKVLYIPDISLVHLGGSSDKQKNSYNKQKKLFQNDLLFVGKFYGDKEAKKTKARMIKAYKLRMCLIRWFYRNGDKSLQIERTLSAIKLLDEI